MINVPFQPMADMVFICIVLHNVCIIGNAKFDREG